MKNIRFYFNTYGHRRTGADDLIGNVSDFTQTAANKQLTYLLENRGIAPVMNGENSLLHIFLKTGVVFQVLGSQHQGLFAKYVLAAAQRLADKFGVGSRRGGDVHEIDIFVVQQFIDGAVECRLWQFISAQPSRGWKRIHDSGYLDVGCCR